MKHHFMTATLLLTALMAYSQPSDNPYGPKAGQYQELRISNDSSQLKGKLTYILFMPIIDQTGLGLELEGWEEQNLYNVRTVISGGPRRGSGGLYQSKYAAENVRLYYLDDYPDGDTIPPPSMVVEYQINEIGITKGKKRHEEFHFWAKLGDSLLLADYEAETFYKHVTMQGVIRVRDVETCREIMSFSEKIEVKLDKAQGKNYGNRRALPKYYVVTGFGADFPTDEQAVFAAQLKLLQRLTYRFQVGAFNRIIKKRHQILTINTSH